MFNIIDVFSGAGGLAEGFRSNEDFNFLCHIEKDKAACSTLRLRNIYWYLKNNDNLKPYYRYIKGEISLERLNSCIPRWVIDNIINEEISNNTMPKLFSIIDGKLRNGILDGIIGGPPCQAYSMIGRASNVYKKKEDERIYLYKFYIEFLKKYSPKFFLFENVKGLISFLDNDGELLFPKIIKEFENVGYIVKNEIINAKNFGVPQNRERIFIFGLRKDVCSCNLFFDYLKKYSEEGPPIKYVFKDLPKIKSGELSCHYKRNRPSLYTRRYLRNKNDCLTQHCARNNNDNDLMIYKEVLKAKKKNINLNYCDLPDSLRTHSNLYSFVDRYKALNYESPSHTIVAHIAKDGHYYIHPDLKQNRSITVREAARLQGFPDNFYFESSRTSAFTQIGNAVPPILSSKIAMTISDLFNCL